MPYGRRGGGKKARPKDDKQTKVNEATFPQDFSKCVSRWKSHQEKKKGFVRALYKANKALDQGDLSIIRATDYAIDAIRNSQNTVTPLIKMKITAYLVKKTETQIREKVKKAQEKQFRDDESLSFFGPAIEYIRGLVQERKVDALFPPRKQQEAALDTLRDQQINLIQNRQHALQQLRLSNRTKELFQRLTESPEAIFSEDNGGLKAWFKDVVVFITSEQGKGERAHTPVTTFLMRLSLLISLQRLQTSMRHWYMEQIEHIYKQAMTLTGECLCKKSDIKNYQSNYSIAKRKSRSSMVF